MTKAHILAGLTLLMTWAPHARADEVFADDVIIENNLCLGGSCVVDETFGSGTQFKMKDSSVEILLENTDTGVTDWTIGTSSGYPDTFYIEDATAGTKPFRIDTGAPENALRISHQGKIALGTAFPWKNLHIFDSDPTIRLEHDGSSSGTDRWDIIANNQRFELRNSTNISSASFTLSNEAPDLSFWLDSNGHLGLGTFSPDGKLHTKGDGVQLAYFESGDGGPVQVRFRTDSENRRFLAVNNADEVKSQIIFLDDRIKFTGQTDSGANLWLSIGPDGIISQGPSCNPGPCDATFDPEVFTVPSVEEHAAYMWENKHLKSVGPTGPESPVNLTEKMGGMLHELELAHIYIEDLHAENTALREKVDALVGAQDHIDRLTRRLAALEARMGEP